MIASVVRFQLLPNPISVANYSNLLPEGKREHTSPRQTAFPNWAKQFHFHHVDRGDLVNGGLEVLLCDSHLLYNSTIAGIRCVDRYCCSRNVQLCIQLVRMYHCVTHQYYAYRVYTVSIIKGLCGVSVNFIMSIRFCQPLGSMWNLTSQFANRSSQFTVPCTFFQSSQVEQKPTWLNMYKGLMHDYVWCVTRWNGHGDTQRSMSLGSVLPRELQVKTVSVQAKGFDPSYCTSLLWAQCSGDSSQSNEPTLSSQVTQYLICTQPCWPYCNT